MCPPSQTDHNRGKKSALDFSQPEILPGVEKLVISCSITGHRWPRRWPGPGLEALWVPGLTADLLSTSHYLEEITSTFMYYVQFYRLTKIAFANFKCLWLNCIHTSLKLNYNSCAIERTQDMEIIYLRSIYK